MGARFREPSGDSVETNAMGRGVTALVNRRYKSLTKARQVIKRVIKHIVSHRYIFLPHRPWNSEVFQLFHPNPSSVFQLFPSDVSFDSPSPSCHVGLGGWVTRNDAEGLKLGKVLELGEPFECGRLQEKDRVCKETQERLWAASVTTLRIAKYMEREQVGLKVRKMCTRCL